MFANCFSLCLRVLVAKLFKKIINRGVILSNILIIDDNDTMREGMVAIIKKLGYKCDEAKDGDIGISLVKKNDYDLIVTDYRMQGMTGIEVLKQVKKRSPKTEVMVITAYGSIELAVDAMKNGAVDFITKPFSHDEFRFKIQRIIERIKERKELSQVTEENVYLREKLEEQFNYGEIIGNSKLMKNVYRTIQKVASADSSVLIYGESGTGKELVARAIHKMSSRKNKPFIRVNCGALAETLLESELFGHEKGAFSGAIKRKKGRFELAQQGSIFLDEIGDISLNMQTKLLRVLQEREFERVGGEETIQADVRILAATNKNLSEQVEKGKFREDLYYRLFIIPIYLPALRDRKEDIPLLINHFLKKLATDLKKNPIQISEAAVEKLTAYHWPGNVRELENVLERVLVLCENQEIDVFDLPILTQSNSTKIPSNVINGNNINLNDTLYDIEKQLIQRAMNETGGNKSRAAKLLGIKTNLLYYKLEKYDLMDKKFNRKLR